MIELFLISGISYLIFIVSLTSGRLLGSYAPVLLILFSFPHFMATYWVWIRRVRDWKREWLPLCFPVVYLGIFYLTAKNVFGPSGVEVLLKLSYLYLLYHFAQQLYGISIWLGLKHGISYAPWRKLVLRCTFLAAALYAWLEMEMRGVANVLFYHSVSSWNLSSEYIISGFVGVFSISLLAFSLCFWDFLRTRNLKALIVILPIGLSWLWFLPPINQTMVILLPVLHGLQYLPFIKLKGGKLTLINWLGWSLVFVVTGWLLFRWLPFQIDGFLEGTLWPAMILTLLNNHHFIIDGRIWKLRDPENQDLL